MTNKISFFIQKIRGKIYIAFNKRHFNKKAKLLLDGKIKLILKDNSKINISQTLFLGYNSNGNNGRSTIIRLENKSSLFINGSARIFYGGDIMLFENAKLSIGNSYINSGCTIRVTDRIEIGDDCAISFGFTAMDNNFHQINGVNIAKPVIVEDHVWIGAGVTILPGVVVGTGSIIAAGAVVTKSIPPHSLVAGIPARIIKKDIEWKM